MRNTSSSNLSLKESSELDPDQTLGFTHYPWHALVLAIGCLLLAVPMIAQATQAETTPPVEQDADPAETSKPASTEEEKTEAAEEHEEQESPAREEETLEEEESFEPEDHSEKATPNDGEELEYEVRPEVSAEPMAIGDETEAIEDEKDSEASARETFEPQSREPYDLGEDDPEAFDLSDLDPAWRLYHEAFIHLASEQPLAAVATLSRLRITYRDHPASALARETLHYVEAASMKSSRHSPLEPGPREREPGLPFYMEQTTNLARAELAAFQTVHGIALALQLALLADVASDELIMIMVMMGGGAGLGLSLWSTTNGITAGQSQAINSGTLWGAWNAMVMSILLDRLIDPLPFNAGLGMLMAGQLGGAAAGALLWNRWGPHSGEVTVATSTGIWSGALTAMLLGILAPDIDGDLMLGAVLVMSDLGLLTGAILSQHIQMSRSRANIINVAGSLGALFGLGSSVIFDVTDVRVMLGFTTLGALSGLALGLHFTEDWDHDKPAGQTSRPDGNESALRFNLMPMNDGAALVLSRDL